MAKKTIKKSKPACYRIRTPTQKGGYKKDTKLKSVSQKDRLERTFTQVLSDGTTAGSYTGYDYIRPKKDPSETPRTQGTSWITAIKKAYSQNCTEQRQRTGKEQCEPAVITLRETTPGNNLADFSFRERKYYLQSIPVPEPVRVRGDHPRTYKYVTKAEPMKKNETLAEFRARKPVTIKQTAPKVNKWREHLAEFREANPDLSYREAMKAASKTYQK